MDFAEKLCVNDEIIIRTERTYLRRLKQSDFHDLCRMLKDKDVMYAYEHAFSDEEAHAWLDRQLKRYEDYDFGLWAVILKENGELIGQCGITMQDAGDRQVMEIGYLLCKEHWHKGYAAEAACACRDYAFEVLGAEEVYSIIRDSNISSQNVAKRMGMEVCGGFIKHYYGMDMPHLLFRVRNTGRQL